MEAATPTEATPEIMNPVNRVGPTKGKKTGSHWMKTPEGKERLAAIMRKRWNKIRKSGKKYLGRPTGGQGGVKSRKAGAAHANVVPHVNGTGPTPTKRKKTVTHVAHIYYLDSRERLQQARVEFTGFGELLDVFATRFAPYTLTEARLEFEV